MNHDGTVLRSWGGGGGGGGGVGRGSTQQVGRRPEVQPLTLLYTIFDRKGIPVMYPLLKIGLPFIYLKRRLYLFSLLLNAPSLE